MELWMLTFIFVVVIGPEVHPDGERAMVVPGKASLPITAEAHSFKTKELCEAVGKSLEKVLGAYSWECSPTPHYLRP